MQAEWKINGIFKADAAKVAQEIGEEQSTPEEVLEKAKDPNTELHKCFEWDDSVAAHKYRLQQASKILRLIVYPKKNEEETPLRYFLLTSEKNTYQPTKLFLQQKDEYQLLLERAKAELMAFKQKYSMLSELEEVLKAIDEL